METHAPTRWRGAGSSMVPRLPHIGFHGCHRLRGQIRGPHGVRPDAGRNNKCFSVMDLEWRESTGWAFDDGAIAFHKVEYMNGAICMVKNRQREPMPPCFDELEPMQTRFLFAPARARVQVLKPIDQVLLNPIGAAGPVDVRQSVIEVDGPWPAVQTGAAPVPELEGEDVGRGANLENYAVASRAVNGACR